MYDKTVSSCIAVMAKKVKLQMKAHLFDSKDPVSFIGFTPTFKLTRETNRIHEEATM